MYKKNAKVSGNQIEFFNVEIESYNEFSTIFDDDLADMNLKILALFY